MWSVCVCEGLWEAKSAVFMCFCWRVSNCSDGDVIVLRRSQQLSSINAAQTKRLKWVIMFISFPSHSSQRENGIIVFCVISASMFLIIVLGIIALIDIGVCVCVRVLGLILFILIFQVSEAQNDCCIHISACFACLCVMLSVCCVTIWRHEAFSEYVYDHFIILFEKNQIHSETQRSSVQPVKIKVQF